MKLSLDALKEKAELAVSEELLTSISGGYMEQCHEGSCGYANEWADRFWHWLGATY